jgi:hypothetical protein
MSGPTWSSVTRALGASRPLWWIGGSALAYLGLRLLFVRLAEAEGLLTPTGAPSVGVLVLGLAVLGLRLVLLFVAPAFLVYGLLERLLGPAGHDPSPGDAP